MVITETELYLCIKPYKLKYKNRINQKPYKLDRFKPKNRMHTPRAYAVVEGAVKQIGCGGP